MNRKQRTWFFVHSIITFGGAFWTFVGSMRGNPYILACSLSLMLAGYVGIVSTLSLSEE